MLSPTLTGPRQVHPDGEVEVLGAKGTVGIVLLPHRHLGQELGGAQHHAVVVVGVPVAQPLQVQRHAQVGQVQEAAVVIPGWGKRPPSPPAQWWQPLCSRVHAHLEAVRTLMSRLPLKTNCPGFQWKERWLHSQCMFSVVL